MIKSNNQLLYKPAAFFLLDFLLTWIPLWLLVEGLMRGWFLQDFGLLYIAGGSAVPSAILFVYSTRNKAFIRDFWIRVIDFKRISPAWWCVILFLPVTINICGIFISIIYGGSPEQFTLSASFMAKPLIFTLFVLVFGPLPEELGWRGYGLDALRTKMNLLKASILLGIIWGAWHFPLLWIPGTFQQLLMEYPLVCLSYFLAFIPASILMSWIYYRTNRSTLSAIMFHFAVNFSGEALSLSMETRIIQTILTSLLAVIVVLKEWPMFSQNEFWLSVKSDKLLPDKEAGGIYA